MIALLLIDRPHQTGIYRVPGENRVMQATKAKLNGERMQSFGCPCSTFPQLTTLSMHALTAGAEVDFATDPSFSDPHNLASLVKLWLRELPEIISPTFYDSFIQANNIEGYEERLCAIRDLIWSLPATSFHLLDRLCEHLHLIAEHELENQMHASNLAIVFAPTILRPPEGSDSYAILSEFGLAETKAIFFAETDPATRSVSNLGKAAKLVSSLIVQHHWIFSGQETEEATEADAVAGAVEEHLKEGQAGGEQPGGSAPNAEDNPHQQSASISRGQQEEVGRGAPSDGVEEGSSSHRPPVTA